MINSEAKILEKRGGGGEREGPERIANSKSNPESIQSVRASNFPIFESELLSCVCNVK